MSSTEGLTLVDFFEKEARPSLSDAIAHEKAGQEKAVLHLKGAFPGFPCGAMGVRPTQLTNIMAWLVNCVGLTPMLFRILVKDAH